MNTLDLDDIATIHRKVNMNKFTNKYCCNLYYDIKRKVKEAKYEKVIIIMNVCGSITKKYELYTLLQIQRWFTDMLYVPKNELENVDVTYIEDRFHPKLILFEDEEDIEEE